MCMTNHKRYRVGLKYYIQVIKIMQIFSIEELQVFPDKGITVSKIQRLESQRRQIGVQEAGCFMLLGENSGMSVSW